MIRTAIAIGFFGGLVGLGAYHIASVTAGMPVIAGLAIGWGIAALMGWWVASLEG